MQKNGFYYNRKAYCLNEADWHESSKQCQSRSRCGENAKVCSGLVVHCCKHVVYGTDHERQLYAEAAEKLALDSTIPPAVRSPEDEVVKNYRKLSKEVLACTYAISLSGEGGNFRIACEGNGGTEGITDYLGFETHGNWGSVLGLISSYFNFSSPENFCMLRLIKQRYMEHLDTGKGVSCVPAVTGSIFGKRHTQVPAADYAFQTARLLYSGENDNALARAALAMFYFHKRQQDLRAFYGALCCNPEFCGAVSGQERLDSFILQESENKKSKESQFLYEQIKYYHHVYAARLALQYLLRLGGEEFRADAVFKRDGLWNDLNLMFFIENKPSIQRKCRGELLLHMSFVRRIKNTFKNHFFNNQTLVLDGLHENEERDSSIGSVADYSAFTLVSNAVLCFVAAYELLLSFRSSYHSSSEIYESLKNSIYSSIDTLLLLYNGAREKRCGKLLDEWWDFFDILFDLTSRSEELSEMRNDA